jgi:nucleotide-binding universal stress UspA family protein
MDAKAWYVVAVHLKNDTGSYQHRAAPGLTLPEKKESQDVYFHRKETGMEINPEDKTMKIYLAIDGSEHSWSAVDLLKSLALRKQAGVGELGEVPYERSAPAHVTLLTVLLPREAANYTGRVAALEKAKAALEENELDVDIQLLVGYPSEALNNYAAESPPDLFVLGAKGLRSTLSILLGGVAQQLVEYASWPVMIVRAPLNGLKHILLATDGSPYSKCAIEYLKHFPIPGGVRLTIMHVMPPLYPPEVLGQRYPAMPESLIPYPVGEQEFSFAREAQEENDGQELVKQAAAAFTRQDVEVESCLRRGDAATELIDFIKEHQVDLVVTGSRGISGVKGFLLGSVSRKLVHYSGCSVLVVKSPPASYEEASHRG